MVKKICFFSTSFAYHKQIKMENLQKILPKEVDLFLLTPPAQNKYKLSRTKVIEISGNKLNFVLKLRKFCEKKKIDILNNLGGPREVGGMFLATLFIKTKFILNFAGNIFYDPKIHRTFRQKIFRITQNLSFFIPLACAKRIITPAEDIKQILQRYFFFMKDKISQLDYIIDEKIFTPQNKKNMRKKLKLPANKKIIIFVGRIQYLKGSDILYSLIEKNKDKFFILVGAAMDVKFKNKKFKNALIIDALDTKKLASYYSAANLCVFPSRVEAYALAPREAMLCGTPSIVSDIIALRLLKYAFKAKLTTKSMQKKMDYFFSLSKKEIDLLREKGRKFVIETSSFDSAKKKYLKIFLN